MSTDSKADDGNTGTEEEFVLESVRHVQQTMRTLRRGSHADLWLKAVDRDELIPVHRDILCVHSTFFKALFGGGIGGGEEKSVTNNIDTHSRYDILSLLIDFIYLGKAKIRLESILELVHETDFYGIASLREELMLFLGTALSLDTVLPCLRYSIQFSDIQLNLLCIRFIHANGDMVLPHWTNMMRDTCEDDVMFAQDMLLDIGGDEFRGILASTELACKENDVLEFVLEWCRAHDDDSISLQRFVFFSDIIRWQYVSSSKLEDMSLERYPFISIDRLLSLINRNGRRHPQRHTPSMRWCTCEPGLQLDELRVRVERVNSTGIKGDVTVLSPYRIDPSKDACRFEVKIEKSPRGQVCLGLWSESALNDGSNLYTFTNPPTSYSLDLCSGSIFIGLMQSLYVNDTY